jgi:hypothetical protein
MFEDLQDRLVGELGVEQGRALELREPSFAGAAVKKSVVLRSERSTDRKIPSPTLAVEPTLGILATEERELIAAVHNGKILGWT